MMKQSEQSKPLVCNLLDKDEHHNQPFYATPLFQKALRMEKIANGVRMVFANDLKIQDEIESFIRQENQCCSFLDVSLNVQPSELILKIKGPDEAQQTIDTMFNQLANGR